MEKEQQKLIIVVKYLRTKKIDPEVVFSFLLKKEIKIEADKSFKNFKLLDVRRNKYLTEAIMQKLFIHIVLGYNESAKKWKSLKKPSFNSN